jgi:hypothetical protein
VLRSRRLDPATHKRYLDYRERHAYFGRQSKVLGMAEFAAAEAEHRALDAKEPRDDEEEARWAELSSLLLVD